METFETFVKSTGYKPRSLPAMLTIYREVLKISPKSRAAGRLHKGHFTLKVRIRLWSAHLAFQLWRIAQPTFALNMAPYSIRAKV